MKSFKKKFKDELIILFQVQNRNVFPIYPSGMKIQIRLRHSLDSRIDFRESVQYTQTTTFPEYQKIRLHRCWGQVDVGDFILVTIFECW